MTTENYHYNPLNQYDNTLEDEWFTPENRKRIVAMAIHEWKKRNGTKPIILLEHIDWAICSVVDKNVWEQNFKIQNLRILAAERLLDRMAEADYNYGLDYFNIQEKLRDQEVPIPCGSHFQDKQFFISPNIL